MARPVRQPPRRRPRPRGERRLALPRVGPPRPAGGGHRHPGRRGDAPGGGRAPRRRPWPATCWIKQCGHSLTGSFKDLGMTVLVVAGNHMRATASTSAPWPAPPPATPRRPWPPTAPPRASAPWCCCPRGKITDRPARAAAGQRRPGLRHRHRLRRLHGPRATARRGAGIYLANSKNSPAHRRARRPSPSRSPRTSAGRCPTGSRSPAATSATSRPWCAASPMLKSSASSTACRASCAPRPSRQSAVPFLPERASRPSSRDRRPPPQPAPSASATRCRFRRRSAALRAADGVVGVGVGGAIQKPRTTPTPAACTSARTPPWLSAPCGSARAPGRSTRGRRWSWWPRPTA